MTKIVDLFGHDTLSYNQPDWPAVVAAQHCPFVDKPCYKTRKSQSEVAIGTCTVSYSGAPIMICPLRLLERRQIFIDCLHLLGGHEPGNELHIFSEFSVPGGSIDYILASTRGGKIRDFVALELQTLDTTGSVWLDRQKFVHSYGVEVPPEDIRGKKSFGMNWKMTAKTILVQLHHKIQTLEAINKHLVLVVQDRLLEYVKREFSFDHLNSARNSDPMHFHAYRMARGGSGSHSLTLDTRLSTDSDGVAKALGLQGEAKIDLDVIVSALEKRITDKTRFDFNQAPEPMRVDPDE
jgi:Restriction endonuclease NotI